MNNTDISFLNVYTGDRPSLLLTSNPKSIYVDGLACFVEMNNCFPSNIMFDNIKIPNFKEEIIEKYKIRSENIIEGSYPYHKNRKIKYIQNQITFMIDKDLVVQAWGSCNVDDIYEIRLYYCHTTNVEKKTEFSNWINSHYIENGSSEIGIIGNGLAGLFIRFFKVDIPNVSINEYYNDDFSEIHDKILEKLSNVNFNKGVILLHGKPGTGKTTYIRYLSSLIDKKMIFVPQELAYQISSPNFLSLLMDYPNSILILEDSENVIKDRIGNDNSPVTSILNISDGLLSDCLNLQMICTFNTDLGRIDKALLRKGRIITKYKFEDLDFNKANKLSEKYGLKKNYSKNVTLSEIFNPEDDDYLIQNKSIGF